MVSKNSWFSENYPRALAWARRLRRPGSRRTPTDLLHTVFRRLPDRLSHVRNRSAFVRRWIQEMDRTKARELREPVADSERVERSLSANEALDDGLRRLTEILRDLERAHPAAARAFERRRIHGLSVDQIAELQAEPVARVYERLRLADDWVRRRIAEGTP